MPKPRGRIMVVCTFPSGGTLTIETRKDKSMTADEIVAALRKYASQIENAITPKAEDAQAPDA